MNTVKTLKALANDTRLEIVRMLLGKAMCIHALARHFHVSETGINNLFYRFIQHRTNLLPRLPLPCKGKLPLPVERKPQP